MEEATVDGTINRTLRIFPLLQVPITGLTYFISTDCMRFSCLGFSIQFSKLYTSKRTHTHVKGRVVYFFVFVLQIFHLLRIFQILINVLTVLFLI